MEKHYSADFFRGIDQLLSKNNAEYVRDDEKGIFYIIRNIAGWDLIVKVVLENAQAYLTIHLPLYYDTENEDLKNEIARYINLRTLDGYDYRMNYDSGEIELFAYMDATDMEVTEEILNTFILFWDEKGFAADMAGFMMVIGCGLSAESAGGYDEEMERLLSTEEKRNEDTKSENLLKINSLIHYLQ